MRAVKKEKQSTSGCPDREEEEEESNCVHTVCDVCLHRYACVNAWTYIQDARSQKGTKHPRDDSKENGAMLYRQCCHNIEAGCVKGTAEWQQSVDLLHCPIGHSAGGQTQINVNDQ